MRTLALLVTAVSAHAGTLGFEALDCPGSGTLDVSDVSGDAWRLEEGAFVIRAAPGYLARPCDADPAYTTTGDRGVFGVGTSGVPVRLERQDRLPFSLDAMVLSEYGAIAPFERRITVFGQRADGGSVSHVHTTAGQPFVLETVPLPADFDHVLYVEWIGEAEAHLFHALDIGPPAGLALRIAGSCPGAVDVGVRNLTPGGRFAVVQGGSGSGARIPGGPCAGGLLDLSSASLVGVLPSGTGAVDRVLTVPGGACGDDVQVVDLVSCETSNLQTF